MGQYYMPLTIGAKGKKTVYNRDVNRKYTLAKLTEHSWWRNPFVCTITRKLYKHPMKIAWVGDYANDFLYYKDVWDDNTKSVGVKENKLLLDKKFLVNHDKREYVNCDDYYIKSTDRDDWCLHPLPILTCVGNGRGGGDYYGKTGKKYVGSWCLDKISVEDTPPEGFRCLDVSFVD